MAARELSSLDQGPIDLLEIEEVAAILGKRPQTVRNWIARRQFPYVPVGNRNVVPRKLFVTWLERREFKPWR